MPPPPTVDHSPIPNKGKLFMLEGTTNLVESWRLPAYIQGKGSGGGRKREGNWERCAIYVMNV